jgi:hypothetical protein
MVQHYEATDKKDEAAKWSKELDPQMPMPAGKNAGIELHDSDVESITAEALGIVFRLNAYVHRTDGVPGSDPGTGWMQCALVRIRNAELIGATPKLPCTLSDGSVTIGNTVYHNIIPSTLSSASTSAIDLVFTSGERLQVRGEDLSVSLFGEPSFVDNVP